MSSYSDAPISYHLIDDIPENDPIHIIQPKRTFLKWIVLIFVLGLLCIFVVMIITQFPKKSIKPNDDHHTSFSCQLPINPQYEENCTIVAGVLSTSNDKFNQLQGPTSVSLDRQGNIYVADTANHRIRKYFPGNSDQGQTLLDEISNINYPRCLFLDQQSNSLFFLDQGTEGNYRVHLIQLNSNPLESTILLTGNQTKSYGMSLDEHFNIYVSEHDHHQVIKWLSPNYNQYIILLKNQFNYPRSIYFDQRTRNLYVADANRIQRFSINSNQSEIVMQGGSVCPNGIEYDCRGNLYISQDRTIKLVNQNTGLQGIDIIPIQYYSKWSSKPKTNDDRSNPEGIYLDKNNGDLYVVDSFFNLVEKFTIKY